MISGTDPRRLPDAAPAGGSRPAQARAARAAPGFTRLAAAAALALAAAAIPAAAVPAAAPAARVASARPPALATPAELRSILEKAGKALAKAEGALRGSDPGEVSLLLARSDEHLERFQAASGLEALVKAIQEARAAAGESDMAAADGPDMTAAAAAVRRARDLMVPVAEYTVLRQAAEAGHAALRAADARDRPEFLAALDRLEAAALAPVLLARLREARDAISRGRLAMVRRDMKEGRAQVAAARRAHGGLEYAGALSRASFALAVGAELLASNSVIAARDQIQKAQRDLRRAAESAPGGQRAALEEARARAAAIWKRSGRTGAAEAVKLADVARLVETVRLQQR